MDQSGKKPESKSLGSYLVILILLAGWVITIGWFSTSYNNQIRVNQQLAEESSALRLQLATQTEELQQEIQLVGQKVSDFELYLQNQTALIARVTGDIVPLQMPPGWDDTLVRLEQLSSDASLRPVDAQTANAFLNDVRKLIAQTPAWAEPYYLERLANLRWAGLVFNELTRTLNENSAEYVEELQQHFDNLVELETIAPFPVDERIMTLLREHAQALQAESAQHVRTAAIRQAEGVLEGAENPDQPIAELLTAYAWLERVMEDPEINGLKHDLTNRMTMIETQIQLEQINERYASLKQTAEHDAELLEQGTRLLIGELGAMRGRLAFEGMSMKALDDSYKSLEESLLELQKSAYEAEGRHQRSAVIRYQEWALNHIRATESALARAKTLASNNAIVGENWGDHEFKIVTDAMTKLLEIDTRFLDWPLADLYQQTMLAGNRLLIDNKGENARKDFARNSVKVEKKPLSDS
jgi:hypothetical protein